MGFEARFAMPGKTRIIKRRKPARKATSKKAPRRVAKLPPPPPQGAYSHIELYSSDPNATERFYEDVFGWRFSDMSYGPGMLYRTYSTPRAPSGGVLERRDGPFQPPSVLTYLQTDNLDGVIEGVERHGGKVLVPRYEIANVGAFVIFEAPGGIVQAAWQNLQGGNGR